MESWGAATPNGESLKTEMVIGRAMREERLDLNKIPAPVKGVALHEALERHAGSVEQIIERLSAALSPRASAFSGWEAPATRKSP
jgi:hypothetical protein